MYYVIRFLKGIDFMTRSLYVLLYITSPLSNLMNDTTTRHGSKDLSLLVVL